jgi:hypothetical protein
MIWRKWLVRCLVFTITSGLGAAGLLYQQWTNPASVRHQVVDHLSTYFVGAHVSLDSARLRLLGGVSLRELRLSRRDDPNNADVLYVPEATVHLDKERVSRGEFAIRKIELIRPHLRVRRTGDGRWNVAGLLAPPDLNEPIPTIEWRQATVVVEDQLACPHLPPMEITDLYVTMINDPLPTIHFQGKGSSRLAEVVAARGVFQRATGDTAVALQADGIPVGPPLVQRLSAYAAALSQSGDFQLDGTARLEAQLAYRADPASWTHQVRWQLSGGHFRHEKIPLPLDDLALDLRCTDGHLMLERLTARSGPAEVALTASAAALDADADFHGEVQIAHLPVTSDVFAQLPENLQKLNKDYSPTGPLSLTLSLDRSAGQLVQRFTVRPEDMAASFVKFPYPLEHITGTLEQVIDPQEGRDDLHIDLAGYAGHQRIWIKGDVRGKAPQQSAELKIWGDDIPLDAKLMNALPAQHQRVAAAFHPAGLANFEAFFRREPSAPEWNSRYVVRFHHTTVHYEVFPYPLEEVSGVLDLQPGHWDAYHFRGTHNGGVFQATGRFQLTSDGDLLTVHLRGDDVSLDDDLKAALTDPDLKQTWNAIQPRGRMNFAAQVDRVADKPPEVRVGLTATGCSVKPEFFPYPLEAVTGNAYYAQRRVYLENLQARHGGSFLRLEKGEIRLEPGGGLWADMNGLHGDPLVFDADLREALPPGLRRACDAVGLHDPVRLTTRLVVATAVGNRANPDVYWQGRMDLNGAALHLGVPVEGVSGTAACEGRYTGRRLEGLAGNILVREASLFSQPVRDVHAAVQIRPEAPDVLLVPELRARVYGGEVYGPVRVEFGSRIRFETDLTASQVQLEQFGRQNLGRDAKLSGLATARLHLEGKGPDLQGLTGRGTVDVPSGRLATLPPLLDLLKFLSIRLPDGTAFEEAHATFSVQGPRVVIERADLFGNSISLRGKGEMKYDGSDVDMDFYAVWARVTQMLPPLIKDLPHDVSKYLLKIHMQGRLGDVRFTREPVPILVDPIKGLLERMVKRGQQPGVRGQESGVRGQESAVRNQGSGVMGP